MGALTSTEQQVVERTSAEPMLEQVLAWSAVNSGSRNLDGLARMASLLGDAFSALPGSAVLVERMFRGSEVRYTVELPSGLRLPCSQPSATTIPAGTRVHVGIELHHVIAFPREPVPSVPATR